MTARLDIALQTVSVQRGGHWALRDVSLRLNAGERWALIGANGAGKTQLLKLLSGDVWPTPTGRERRGYSAGGRAVELVEAKPRIAYIGAELQDKYARYGWNLAVLELVATGLRRTALLESALTRAEERRAAAMLGACGMSALAKRRFLSLSYGQKRLALLARALVQAPDWLLLDEFYNGLDTAHRRRIDGILRRALRRDQSWIAAAHRAADIPRGTQKVMELREGRLILARPLAADDLARLGARAEVSGAREAAEGTRHKPPGRRGKILVSITAADLYVDYRAILRDVTWQLRAGEHWAVFGANGAGKSSFLKLLFGDLSPASGGRIERPGLPRGMPIAAWKRRVGYVSPELQSDYAANVTVLDLVASGRYSSIGLCEKATPADLRAARRWLVFFALASLASRRARELSYGQLRRALFARALAADARILLLDEPLTGLDPRQRAMMKRLLERLMKQDVTLVIAGHHPEDLPRGMTHALHLHKRRAEPVDCHFAT